MIINPLSLFRQDQFHNILQLILPIGFSVNKATLTFFFFVVKTIIYKSVIFYPWSSYYWNVTPEHLTLDIHYANNYHSKLSISSFFIYKPTTPGDNTNILWILVDFFCLSGPYLRQVAYLTLTSHYLYWIFYFLTILTTPGDNTNISGVLVVESSTTWAISRTGGSVNFDPRLFIMNEVAQKETRSGRSDRTINILCNSLHALSHSPERYR